MKKVSILFTVQDEYTISEFMNWIDDELMSQKDECPFNDYEVLESYGDDIKKGDEENDN